MTILYNGHHHLIKYPVVRLTFGAPLYILQLASSIPHVLGSP